MEWVLKMQEAQLKMSIVGPLADILKGATNKLQAGEKLTDTESMLINIALAGFMGAAK